MIPPAGFIKKWRTVCQKGPLVLVVNFYEFVASTIPKNTNFGFNSTFACSDGPLPPSYPDPIVGIEVLVKNPETGITSLASDSFKALDHYGSGLVSLGNVVNR